MKRQVLLFAFLFAFGIVQAQHKGNTVIGKWQGTDDRKQTGGIEFLKDGTAKLLMPGKGDVTCGYTVDYKKNPISITLTFSKNGKPIRMFGLLKFINANSMKWEMFPNATKPPTAFSKNPVGTLIILNRI